MCLWHTKTKSHKSLLNICEIFSNECQKENIDFGFYYSWFEFGEPFTLRYFDEYYKQHWIELLSFNPKYLWFDGDWKINQKRIRNDINNFILRIKKLGIIVNDRLGQTTESALPDYRVFKDRYIPDSYLSIKWQHINTVGYSWGYNEQQEEQHYKTGQMLYDIYCEVKNLGGDFLINIGPKIDGTICSYESSAIEYLATKI